MKIRAFVYGFLLTLLLSACGGKESATSQETVGDTPALEGTTWSTAEADLTGLGYTTSIFDVGNAEGDAQTVDGMVLLAEETETGHRVTQISVDGSVLHREELVPPEDNGTLCKVQFTEDALYCIYECINPSEDSEKPIVHEWMQKYTAHGELVWQKQLFELLGIQDGTETYSDFIVSDHTLLLATDKKIYFLDEDGQAQDQIDSPGEGIEFCCSSQGDIYIKNVVSVSTLNVQARSIAEESFQLSNGERLFTGAGPYDLLLLSDAKLRGVSLEERCITELVRWADCDLSSSVAGVVYLGENQYGIAAYKTVLGDTQMLNLSFVPQGEVPEKTIIQMAVPAVDPTYWADTLGTETVYAINNFNRTNDDYRVEIETYESAERLQLMMTTETPPDLIVFGTNLAGDAPSQKIYEAKEYLCDLTSYLDSDPELQKSDFLPNVLNAFGASSGAIYAMPTEIYAVTEYISAEYANGITDWSIENAYELMKSLPEDTCLIGCDDPDLAIDFLLPYCVDRFVDVEACSCNFENQEFYDLLYLCRDDCGPETPIMNSVSLDGGISSYLQEGGSLIGDQAVFLGYPEAPGNGAALKSLARFSITASSTQQTGAWRFLRTLLLPEFQEQLGGHGMFFSPRKDIFEERMAVEQEHFPEISPEEYKAAAELIQGAAYCADNESPAISIVKEEAAAFFAGDKSAEDVAKIVQNRVSIYLAEQQ